jgi:tetratricopeptide (TPR) repeat protein
MRWQLLIPNMVILNFKARLATEGRWIIVFFLLAIAGTVCAGEAINKIFTDRAEVDFRRTRVQYQSNPNDSAAALQFTRACFDLADLVTNDTERATLAKQGIAVCRQWLTRDSNAAPAHYYLAMNSGELAKAEAPSIAAYKLVREIEREFKQAADLDEHFDYAGPERSLGLLYRDAPGWPLSIGSRHKAREWLERAGKLAPEYPENHLNLAESYLQWHEYPAAKSELHALDALWPAARTNLVGPAWEPSWADWSAGRETTRKRLGETSQPAESPKK